MICTLETKMEFMSGSISEVCGEVGEVRLYSGSG